MRQYILINSASKEQLVFFPKTETIDGVRRIHFEPQRDEVVLIMRCCNGNIDKVNDFLNYNVNIRKGTHYFPQKEDGTYGHGRWWWMNGENCSVFAWNAYAIYYNDFTEPDWDNVWGIGGEAPRPEEYRQFLAASGKCSVIVRRKGWKGNENNKK